MIRRAFIVIAITLSTLVVLMELVWERAKAQSNTPSQGLHFVGANQGWAVGNGGLILHTANGGGAWTPQISGVTQDLFEVQFVDQNTGWVIGAGGAILHTTNGGATWQPQDSPAAVKLNGLFILNAQQGWIGFPGGLLRTIDGGVTWRKTGIGISFQVQDLHFFNSTAGVLITHGDFGQYEILLTTDGGETWTKATGCSSADLYALDFPTPTYGVAVGGLVNAEICITTDAGKTWTEVSNSLNFTELREVQFIDANHGWAVAPEPTRGSIIYTADGGQHWSVPASLPGNDIHFVSLTKGFLATNQGVQASSDGGYFWQTSYATAAPKVTPTPSHTPVTPITPTNKIDFIDGQQGWVVGNKGLIIHTATGGSTWTTQQSGVTQDLFEVQFVDQNTGWATGAGGTILHTSNGGAAWQLQTSPAAVNLYGLFMLDTQRGWIGFRGGVLRTIDGGVNWRKTGTGIAFQVQDLHFFDSNAGVLVTHGDFGQYEILWTADGGETWTKATGCSSANLYALDFPTATYGVAVGGLVNAEICITTDAGKTWTEVPNSLRFIELRKVQFIDAQHGWAVAPNPSGGSIIYTADGGQHWGIPAALPGNDIHFVSLTQGFLATNQGVQSSSDGGYLWKPSFPMPPTPTPTFTPTPTPTTTPTTTPTPSVTVTTPVTATPPTAPPTPTATATLPASDDYEPNNSCPESQIIAADGREQSHTFQSTEDEDWVRFAATANTTYRIEVITPNDSPADVTLELYSTCNRPSIERWDETFTPGVRLDFAAPLTGPLFLKLRNQGVIGSSPARYQLSVRPLPAQPTVGAVIIVAGRLKATDPLQRNIHNITNRVYSLFQAQGYTNDDIYYLATDATLPGYDAVATKANLQSAITQWAVGKVGPNKPLTLYLMDHGDRDQFYLDGVNDQILIPDELDGWLTAFEQAVPNAKLNVIVEACYTGSFIATPLSISKAGRVVITSSDNNWSAYASRDGAHFSDHLLTALQQGRNLFSSFTEAQSQVNHHFNRQNPWLDANGDNLPNQQADFAIAAERGFAYVGTLNNDAWPPYIVTAAGPTRITNRRGLLTATVRDDQEVESVWAVIYAPSYTPPTNTQELTAEIAPTILFHAQGNTQYAVEYPAFDEAGIYRVVFSAQDRLGNLARPIEVLVPCCQSLFLPLVAR